ncbi:MAG: 5-formyltetrahydrofolate cyclo-ligase [Arcicella sp.]|nr:5-formyltetrahydrofolate cyclo-ligase [Arcicella sp.]
MIKSQLRKYYLSKRKAISAEEIVIKSQQITDLFFQNFDLLKVENIHIFLPIIKHNEINTWLIIRRLQQKFPKIVILIPKIIPENFEIENFLFDEKKLIVNPWGILEPSGENQDKIEPEKIDLVIIPLLIFDKNGNRVGYGKGFYDRFLQQCNPKTLKIGVCLEEPIEMIEDVNEFDIKMDFCITPIKIYKF